MLPLTEFRFGGSIWASSGIGNRCRKQLAGCSVEPPEPTKCHWLDVHGMRALNAVVYHHNENKQPVKESGGEDKEHGCVDSAVIAKVRKGYHVQPNATA